VVRYLHDAKEAGALWVVQEGVSAGAVGSAVL
jgi:hypothetical protein